MRVFIDANIYLQLFGPSGDEADYIGKLIKLIRAKKIFVVFPRITQYEVLRDMENIYDVKFKRSKKKKPESPGAIEEEGDELRKIYAKHTASYEEAVAKDVSQLETKYRVVKKNVIDKIFKDLRPLTEDYPETDELVRRAHLRRLKGYPPGKGPHMGDELAWEILLEHCVDDDLTIIAKDLDWVDKISEKLEFHSLLREEWEGKTKKKIRLLNILGEFIKEFPEGKNITSENIEVEEQRIPQYYGGTSPYGITGLTGPTGPSGVTGLPDPYIIGSYRGDTGYGSVSLSHPVSRVVPWAWCYSCNNYFSNISLDRLCPTCGLPTLQATMFPG